MVGATSTTHSPTWAPSAKRVCQVAQSQPSPAGEMPPTGPASLLGHSTLGGEWKHWRVVWEPHTAPGRAAQPSHFSSQSKQGSAADRPVSQ